MVFNLDYDRRSDLDDSVGYWFIQPKGREECRVYYSCVTKLRTWVPSPVYAIMTKLALKQATVWVDHESVKEVRALLAWLPPFALSRQSDFSLPSALAMRLLADNDPMPCRSLCTRSGRSRGLIGNRIPAGPLGSDACVRTQAIASSCPDRPRCGTRSKTGLMMEGFGGNGSPRR
jgi:hypothetical protein